MDWFILTWVVIGVFILWDIASDVRKLRETNDRIEELYLERNGE